MPRRLFSTATHDDHLVDPDDTYVLDDTVCFVGQRVAAVVAETEGIAEAACRLLDVRYEILPAVLDPEAAMQTNAPVLHEKGVTRRGNIFAEIHGELGSVAGGFAAASVVPERTYSTSRVQHVHLETHGSITWLDAAGRIHVRTSTSTSSQAPSGGFRGYGASQTTFAIECAIDELALKLGISSFALRRRNMIRPGDWMESVWSDPSDVDFGSYGLDQCKDMVEQALASGRGAPKPAGEDWLEGTGIALAMLDCDTYDRIGPLGAKSQGECAINPVAPAIANALADATGKRFAHLPLTPDRIFTDLPRA